jgi:hypothetical protein
VCFFSYVKSALTAQNNSRIKITQIQSTNVSQSNSSTSQASSVSSSLSSIDDTSTVVLNKRSNISTSKISNETNDTILSPELELNEVYGLATAISSKRIYSK